MLHLLSSHHDFTIYLRGKIIACTNHKAMHVESRCHRRHATKTSSRHSARRTVRPRPQRGLNEGAPRVDGPRADGQVQRAVPSPSRCRSCVQRARGAPHTFPLRAARTPSFPFKESSTFRSRLGLLCTCNARIIFQRLLYHAGEGEVGKE